MVKAGGQHSRRGLLYKNEASIYRKKSLNNKLTKLIFKIKESIIISDSPRQETVEDASKKSQLRIRMKGTGLRAIVLLLA
jgi:hypothetical protein